MFNPPEEKEIDEKLFDKIIKEYNDKHIISNAQKIQKFTIVRDGLTIDNGLLTPTMKVKRSVVVGRYTNKIDEMYAGTE